MVKMMVYLLIFHLLGDADTNEVLRLNEFKNTKKDTLCGYGSGFYLEEVIEFSTCDRIAEICSYRDIFSSLASLGW